MVFCSVVTRTTNGRTGCALVDVGMSFEFKEVLASTPESLFESGRVGLELLLLVLAERWSPRLINISSAAVLP